MRRNDVVFGGSMSSPQTLVWRHTQAREEFQAALVQRETPIPDRVDASPGTWRLPNPGWVKVNWDASLEPRSGIMAWAVVIRDQRGQLIVAKCMSRQGHLTPLAAEAYTALMATKQCKAMGLQNIHFEGDAKAVVDAVNSAEEDRSKVGHIIEDIKSEVQSFVRWKMTFIRREGNNVAHVLAKYASHHALNNTWQEPPDCIRDLILLESSALVQ
ncbi:uncharacterized protein LOC132190739 [Corylus avellana]|uniref:uncharacterized protein LOC132190739 n=1 Tax=Corylus avellana TaxID=13451 RepID=UPI00286A99A4|nr:uncharacterized protein LOC132190739 [Corylus avellana]